MDSVLNYPLYDAIVQGFSIPGPGNLSNVSAVMDQIQISFKVRPSLIAMPMSNSSG
jgi:alpha-amylase